jgi:hypothetical protein
MNHDIYIFGSIVRGEVASSSDVDVLVIPFGNAGPEYPTSWSVYRPETIKRYFKLGKLFAWHLHLESVCIFSASNVPFLESIGKPEKYAEAQSDIRTFKLILQQAVNNIRNDRTSFVFEAGLVHTCLRDIAMSASWHLLDQPNFSRYAPYLLPVELPLDREVYDALMRARHASTRGLPCALDTDKVASAVVSAPIMGWVQQIERLL